MVTVKIHPVSIKLIKQGHPWITEDSFTKRFPANESILMAQDQGKFVCAFLHDPNHKSIKGRVFSFKADFNFKQEVAERLKAAIKKRIEAKTAAERDNFYLVFGEGDFLPGLFIQNLGGIILIQSFCSLWGKEIKYLLDILPKIFREENLEYEDIWFQERGINTQPVATNLTKKSTTSSKVIKEFGVNYFIELGKYYDHGLYTDMAALRKKMSSLFENKAVLNLFCYTGALSLFALSKKAKMVYSVDLSVPYLAWLEKNLELNPELAKDRHQTIQGPTLTALKNFVEKKARVDLILCDPPSSSSDGQKRTSALQEYEKLIPLMNSVLSNSGKMILFLNTHQVNIRKFEAKIKSILVEKKLDQVLKIKGTYELGDDCPKLKHFDEGNYLKGIILQKTDKT